MGPICKGRTGRKVGQDLARHYRHRVADLTPGRHAFRLQQVDGDGTTWHSAVAEATVGMEVAYRLSKAYPSPARSASTLRLLVRETQDVREVAYDVLGRRMQTLHAGSVAAYEPVALELKAETLPSGLYLVQADGECFSAMRRAIVVK